LRLAGGDGGNQAIKSEAGIALAENADALEVANNFRQVEGVAMFGGDDAGWGKKFRGAEKGENAAIVFGGGVGRIEINEIELCCCGGRFGSKFFQATQNVERENARAGSDFEGGKIFADEGRGGRVIFDEDGFARATTERFDADCSGAGEEVEETRIGNVVGEDIE
jgi:hypothetical protein